LTVSAIARRVGVDRKTVRKYIEQGLVDQTGKDRALLAERRNNMRIGIRIW